MHNERKTRLIIGGTMNRAQIARLWSLAGLFVLQFIMLITIDNSAHGAAVTYNASSGNVSSVGTGTISSVYDEVGFSFVLMVAAAIVAGFVIYRWKHPLPKQELHYNGNPPPGPGPSPYSRSGI